MPGMTARVNFLTKAAENVLEVANAALRYKPSDAELAALKAQRKTDPSTSTNTTTTGTAQPRANRGSRGAGAPGFGTLYYLDANGKLAMTRVKTGITDGAMTEISGKGVTEGMKVITGTVGATQPAQTATSATPFQPNQQQGGGGQRGGGRGF
jgi:HlyD family secretion protein